MLNQTIVHEDGDLVYLIAPVTPIEPSAGQIEEFAYGSSIVAEQAKQAPNPLIAWYSGHYVEADNPNGNGAMWTAQELALKSLTPRFMPVTVMHDPRSSVGLIADVALRTPERDGVPRAKIDTALAIWAHRYPEVVEEAQVNYAQGSLMQSMECLASAYSCGACGMGFLKLPRGAEQKNWCEHLKGENACRILAATTFTGSGLIFGTRGASGADPMAHLEDFKQEVAEFHQHRTASGPRSPTPRSKRLMDDITITKAEYDALMSRPTAETLASESARADKVQKEFEEVETENVRLRTENDSVKGENATLKDQASKATLADERMGKLGTEFLGKLGDRTKANLTSQAATFQDEEWTARLDELTELTGVKPDAAAVPTPGAPITFTSEEIARQQVAGASPLITIGNDAQVGRGVIASLVKRPAAAARK